MYDLVSGAQIDVLVSGVETSNCVLSSAQHSAIDYFLLIESGCWFLLVLTLVGKFVAVVCLARLAVASLAITSSL